MTPLVHLMRLDGPVTVWIAGADRVAAVTAIADAFGAREHSKLVILDGPAGSGRTFVLEQAYRVFAAAEHDTGRRYWPSELRPGHLVPDGFVPQGESSLERLWLAVDGDVAAGHAMHQLADWSAGCFSDW